ncbi:MAG: sulfatase [Halioglobus sp.]|nr:sulfatase [Halioglobus sp.]|tara:strand:- start:2291 stop:3841 length:1551 start_codon:yes stop_codon:yes gene_type:complete
MLTRLATILIFLSTTSAVAAQRPNIVFIMSDDHAVRAVSAYGDSLMPTPNIDRIAANGMRFDRAYVGNSICGPSRATMLTGLHSHANGFYSNEWSGPFDAAQQTLPKLLQTAGYNTAVIGKWHLYSDPVGFDHWEVIHNAFEQGTYYNPEFRSPAGVEKSTGYVAELVTDKAIDWLDSVAEAPTPFFLIYNHKTPHRNWMPGPQELRDWREDAQVPEPDTLLRDLEGLTRARREARMSISGYMTDNDVKLSMSGNLTDSQAALWESAFADGNRAFEQADLSRDEEIRWKYQRYIKTYLASVKSMDREIGRLLDHLEQSGLSDNTIVVYTSDQGFFLGENGWFDKRWMDEVSSRVPLLVQWPRKVEAGSSNEALVQNIDFAPTLLDAAGVQPVRPMHGVSLLPLLLGQQADWQRDLYYHFYENPGFHGVARHYGIHTGRYKLVHYYRNQEWELFDLQTDPAELRNLYGQPGYDELTRELVQRLRALRSQYQVPDEDPQVPWYHGLLIRTVEQLMRLL